MESEEQNEYIPSKNEALQLIDGVNEKLHEIEGDACNGCTLSVIAAIPHVEKIVDKLQRYIENSEETCRKDADCHKQ